MIEKAWQDYRKRVMPRRVPWVQQVESRRAFYAGAASLFDGLIKGVSEGEDVEEIDLELMESVSGELSQFNESVRAGTA